MAAWRAPKKAVVTAASLVGWKVVHLAELMVGMMVVSSVCDVADKMAGVKAV